MKRLPYLAGSLLVAIAVSSCSSSQDVLAPSAIAPLSQLAETEGSVGTVPAQTASANASASLNPAIASRTKLHFDPIVGATVEAATPLAERLAVRAKARGLALAGSTDPSTTHVLKGYFSTMTEGGRPSSSMSGTYTTAAATGCTGSTASRRLEPARAKAGAPYRRQTCRRSPTTRSTSWRSGWPRRQAEAVPAHVPDNGFFGLNRAAACNSGSWR